MIITYEHRYPQPESTWSVSHDNYEILCPKCHRFEQVENFQIKKEPVMKKNDFLTLIWTNAAFCTEEVLRILKKEQITGFEVRDVEIFKTTEKSKVIHQIYVPETAKPGLITHDGIQGVECSMCGVKRYPSHIRGVMGMKREALRNDLDMQRSAEWYGSGGTAYKEYFVSNRFVRLALENGWKGIRFKVVELID